MRCFCAGHRFSRREDNSPLTCGLEYDMIAVLGRIFRSFFFSTDPGPDRHEMTPDNCRGSFQQAVDKPSGAVAPNGFPRGEGGPEGVGRGMRAEIQKSAPFKDLMKSWLLDENAHKYLEFLRPKFPPDFLFSLASLDSFPPGEAIGCCRTRGFIDSLLK